MNLKKPSPQLVCAILVAIFFGIALYLRVALPFDRIFTAEGIRLAGADAYYHIRLVDSFIHNFPHLPTFDPYLTYPGGQALGLVLFFEWLLGGVIWLVGLGSPTEHTIDVVGVWFPAILGALTVIPVYFIGKEVFGRWAGVISAGLIALLPSEFLSRSILGFTDGDVLQTLLTTVAMLFLIMAIKTARQRQWNFGHLRHGDWAVSIRPLVYSLLAGIFLGMYMLSWLGALLFIFIIAAYLVIQFVIDHLRRTSTDYLCIIGVIIFGVTLLMSLLISPAMFYLASLIIALFIPLVLGCVSWLMAKIEIKTLYYPLTVAGLGLAGLAIFYFANASLFGEMLGTFSFFKPEGATALTTIEMQSLLLPYGTFTLSIAWGNYTTGFIISLISLVIIIYLVVKTGNAEKSLILVWSLVILAANIGQRRFGSYYTVNVALLTGYLSILLYPLVRFTIDYLRGKRTRYKIGQVLESADLEELVTQTVELTSRADKKKAKRLEKKEAKRLQRAQARAGRGRQAGFRATIIHTSVSLWLIVIFFLAFYPTITPATSMANAVPYAPSSGWVTSLSWLRDNTPDPFNNPDAYYQSYELPASGQSYEYPESAYSVLAWWDYGYWITRIAHRIPVANPSQDPKAVTRVAEFLTTKDEATASEMAQELDVSYIIIDDATASSKLWAIEIWARGERSEYSNVYYRVQGNLLIEDERYFYPEYYRLLSTRLYNLECQESVPETVTVISYQEVMAQEGLVVKVVTGKEEFDSYEEAEAFINGQDSGNYRIVSDDASVSPVPVEALENFRLRYSSNSTSTIRGLEAIPEVKIFEYIGP